MEKLSFSGNTRSRGSRVVDEETAFLMKIFSVFLFAGAYWTAVATIAKLSGMARPAGCSKAFMVSFLMATGVFGGWITMKKIATAQRCPGRRQ